MQEGANLIRTQQYKDGKIAAKPGIHFTAIEDTGNDYYLFPEHYLKYKYLIFLFSIIGHIFPIWLYFKGGKGVACFFGANLFLAPIPTILAMILWLFTVKITKLSSLGAILSIFLLTIYQLIFIYGNLDKGIVFIIFLLIFFKHSSNIKRLIKGEENKINL